MNYPGINHVLLYLKKTIVIIIAICKCCLFADHVRGLQDFPVFRHLTQDEFLEFVPCPPPWKLSLLCTSGCNTLSCAERTKIFTNCVKENKFHIGCDTLTNCQVALNCSVFTNTYREKLDECITTTTRSESTPAAATQQTLHSTLKTLPTTTTTTATTEQLVINDISTNKLLFTKVITESYRGQYTVNTSVQTIEEFTIRNRDTEEKGNKNADPLLPHSDESKGIYAVVAVVTVILTIIVCILCFLFWKRKRKKQHFRDFLRQWSTDSRSPIQKTDAGYASCCLKLNCMEDTSQNKVYDAVPVNEVNDVVMAPITKYGSSSDS